MTDPAVLQGARLADGRQVDVVLADGRIESVDPAFSHPSANRVDLSGYVLLPSFIEPHAHLDKALTVGRAEQLPGTLIGAIDAMDVLAAGFTHADVVERSDAALTEYLAHGVTAVRTHVTLGGTFGFRALEAMVEVRSRWAGLVDLQLVGMAGAPTTEAELRAAVAGGADVLGAYPHVEADPIAGTRLCLRVAADTGLPVDLHADETLNPAVLTLARLAELLAELDTPVPVTASHCTSLGMQAAPLQQEVARSVAAAGIPVVCCPLTNLYLLARDQPTATPRGLTAVRALVEAGAVVAGGGDNLRDVFHPLGRADPLETATLLVSAGHLDPAAAVTAVTSAARRALGLPAVEVVPGAPADLVAVRGADVLDALGRASEDRIVWRAGREVARTRVSRTVLGPAALARIQGVTGG